LKPAPDRALARAPSNIALVKYMGKLEGEGNLPENPSLSMTLSGLCSFVEVRVVPGAAGVRWIPEKPAGARGEVPAIDERGAAKFAAHCSRVLERAPDLLMPFDLRFEPLPDGSSVEIRGTNTFPHGAGIASSASSFAALTLAAAALGVSDRDRFREGLRRSPGLRRALARLAREGSGSSCRSFEGPFVSWTGEDARKAESSLAPLLDLVVVVSREPKAVGSSEAHRRVKTSPQWPGRPDRAVTRHEALVEALRGGDLATVARIAGDDSADMHRLFETSDPSFTYADERTAKVMRYLRSLEDPELAITMDAGPNVHVLVPVEKAADLEEALRAIDPAIEVLADEAGNGAELVDPNREFA
jgi:diphosphomevalonate decarboxylase